MYLFSFTNFVAKFFRMNFVNISKKFVDAIKNNCNSYCVLSPFYIFL